MQCTVLLDHKIQEILRNMQNKSKTDTEIQEITIPNRNEYLLVTEVNKPFQKGLNPILLTPLKGQIWGVFGDILGGSKG